MKKEFKIGEKKIGPNSPTFIIAELSGNHHHDLGQAFKLIDIACDAGVDAVKSQTYTPDTITINSSKEYFQVKSGNKAWEGQTLYDLYKEAYTPWDWMPQMKEYAESKGLLFFTSVFDETSVDFMESLGVLLYKVASLEITDVPLLKKIGGTKKPVIVSRGMASDEELSLALKTLREGGASEVSILHCVSSYPAKPEEMNLSTILSLAEKFDVVSGLSNHCLDNKIDELAVASGASIIEKHITLKRSLGGPDAGFSLEPEELKDLVERIRETEKIMGEPQQEAGLEEKGNLTFRKSLFVVKDVKRGELITKENVRSIRPGHGLAPKYYDEIIGKKAKEDIEGGTPLSWDLVI